MKPQLNAFQFINEALTRFESEFEGPLSEHGDKVLAAAFRKYVINQIDGEVRRVEEWMEGLPLRTARKEAEKVGAYYDTLRKVAFFLNSGPRAKSPAVRVQNNLDCAERWPRCSWKNTAPIPPGSIAWPIEFPVLQCVAFLNGVIPVRCSACLAPALRRGNHAPHMKAPSPFSEGRAPGRKVVTPMMTDATLRGVPLRVRLRGPGVPEGRILLSDLVKFGRHLQTAVDRVARVLSGEAVSARPGRRPEHIQSACALEVVAIEPGSFELALDFRRDQTALPGMDMGETALEKLVVGIEGVAADEGALPAGYDEGVLAAWREAGAVFAHGVDAIDFHLRTSTARIDAAYDSGVHRRVVERIQGPVHNRRTFEGRLLMADFQEARFKCRVHPPVGSPVECDFDETLEEVVYDNLRAFVRVTGEAEEDPEMKRIKRLKIVDIEPLEVETEAQSISPDEFWHSLTLEELAAEQGIKVPQPLDSVIGAAADLWEDDRDTEAFVAEIYERRREGRQREERGR